MTVNCDTSIANNIIAYSQERRAKQDAKNSFINQIGNLLVQGINTIPYSTNTESSEVIQNETAVENENANEEVENNKELLKENVIDAIGEEKFNKFSPELQNDILNKFDAYKSILKLSDGESARRITNYVKALESREAQKEMGEYLEEALETEENEGLDNCPIVDTDTDIAEQKVNGSDSEFIQSLINRGEGYVDMYDTNNDEKVDLKEFTDLEAKDSGKPLTAEDKARTEAYFNTISGGDGVIDAKDFASHLAAVARLYDGKDKSSVEDITYKEWFGAQMIGSDDNITHNYNVWRNGYQDAFKQ